MRLLDLPDPRNQKEEVLYLLLQFQKGLTRHDFMALAYVQNSPEIIRRLRYDEMISIYREDVTKKNKFGRTATFGRYVLTDRERARKQYLEISKRKA